MSRGEADGGDAASAIEQLVAQRSPRFRLPRLISPSRPGERRKLTPETSGVDFDGRYRIDRDFVKRMSKPESHQELICWCLFRGKTMAKTGLVVSAHPGDFVWRAGGAIALHAKRAIASRSFACRLASAAKASSPGSSRARRWRRSRPAARTRRERAAEMLGAEIEFFDAGDYPLRLTEAHFDRMVDIYRELNPSLRADPCAGRSL